MAEATATRSARGYRTLCLPLPKEVYVRIVHDPGAFRRALDDRFRQVPELFPAGLARGYELRDDRMSAKQRLPVRRILLRDGTAYSARPSFLMPDITAQVADVEGPLFLRKCGRGHTPGDTRTSGRCRRRGPTPRTARRFSIVGTTVRPAGLHEHLLADEHHQPLDGEKTSIATTVGAGCCLGAEPATTAGAGDLKAAYGVFKDEARDLAPKDTPKTVNTDGWKGAQAAWRALFPRAAILLCFLHGWLKIRDRAKHLKDLFAEVSRRVWEAYHAPNCKHFGRRLRRLREWAGGQLSGVVLEHVLDLGRKGRRYGVAYQHPGGHRTSNMLDRQMRGMNRYFDHGQHLHGSLAACRLHCRAWAPLWNFAPWHPATTRENQGWPCPAERLNKHRYHKCWLQNLLVSASLGGYRSPLPPRPRRSGSLEPRRGSGSDGGT